MPEHDAAPRFLLASDVGGTFTDTVLVDRESGRSWSSKVPSRNRRQEEAVAAGTKEVLRAFADAVHRDQVPGLARNATPGALAMHHGTTVATNALLERRGARTLFLTNAGFEDLLAIRRQDRPDLYDPGQVRPEPLVSVDDRIGLPVRRGPDGADWAPEDTERTTVLEQVLARAVDSGVEAIAVGFLHADLHPEDEAWVAAWLRERLPGVHVSASHEVWPEMREVERFETTVLNASLAPMIAPYLARLDAALGAVLAASGGLEVLRVMDSAGTLRPARAAALLPAGLLLSGPAGGVAAAAGLSRVLDLDQAVTFDVGGTSTDVAFLSGGVPALSTESRVSGFACRFPAVEVHTLGAGGGSVVWRDAGGHVQVGPHSQGAYPGPACYGRGGEEPTLTDALLLAGRIPQGIVFGGRTRPDRQAAFRVFERLASRLGRDLEETFLGAIRLAVEATAGGVHVVTTRRGHDARAATLVAFGGAGPLLAAELAETVGIDRIVVPWDAGTFSARGMVSAPVVARRAVGLALSLDATSGDGTVLEEAWASCAAGLPAGAPRGRVAMRYGGQSHELEVSAAPDRTAAELRAAFEERHLRMFGHRHGDRAVEVVRLVVEHVTAHPDPGWRVDAEAAVSPRPSGLPSEEAIWITGPQGPVERTAPVVWRGDLAPGQRLEGPVIVPDRTATSYVPPGWHVTVDCDTRVLILRRGVV